MRPLPNRPSAALSEAWYGAKWIESFTPGSASWRLTAEPGLTRFTWLAGESMLKLVIPRR